MRKQILKVFLDGVTHAAVSGLAHFFKELYFLILLAQTPGTANADWLMKVKPYLQLAAFFR